MGIAVFDKSRQPQGSPACSRDNGGCTHLCFIAPQGKQCGCPNRYALRGDGRTCQEANFSNCFYRPCQNGGTCYFNFDKVSDDCLCTEYFIGEGCGLYIGNSSITVTLRMKLDEWDENKFQKGIAKGIYDYCIDDTCTNNLRIRQKLSCQSLSRNSSLTHINVTLIGKPIPSLDTIQVNFAVLVSSTEDMKPTPIANTTLLTIIQEKAKLVSQQLGDFEIIYVNGERPSSESDCTKVQTGELPSGEKGKFPGAAVGGIVVVLCLAAVVICGVLCYRRKFQERGNEERHYDDIPDPPQNIRNDLEGIGLRREAGIPIPPQNIRNDLEGIGLRQEAGIPIPPQNIRNDLEGIGLRQEAENPIPQDDFRPNPRRISSNEDGYAGLNLPRDGSYASLENRADGASLPEQQRRYEQLKPRSSAEHSNERAACNQGFERESVREPEENSCGPDRCEDMSSHHAVLCTEKP